MSEFIFKIMEISLICEFTIAIVVSIILIIKSTVTLITHKKQMSTRKYDMGAVLDRWENAEKQFQKDNKIETADKDIAIADENKTIDSNTVKKHSYSYCATKFNLDIAETDEFNNIVKILESKDEKPSLIILDMPTNVKDSL